MDSKRRIGEFEMEARINAVIDELTKPKPFEKIPGAPSGGETFRKLPIIGEIQMMRQAVSAGMISRNEAIRRLGIGEFEYLFEPEMTIKSSSDFDVDKFRKEWELLNAFVHPNCRCIITEVKDD